MLQKTVVEYDQNNEQISVNSEESCTSNSENVETNAPASLQKADGMHFSSQTSLERQELQSRLNQLKLQESEQANSQHTKSDRQIEVRVSRSPTNNDIQTSPGIVQETICEKDEIQSNNELDHSGQAQQNQPTQSVSIPLERSLSSQALPIFNFNTPFLQSTPLYPLQTKFFNNAGLGGM